MSAGLEQKDLAQRWGVSVRTVARVVKLCGTVPIRFRGLAPVFTVAQADEMAAKWRQTKEATIEAMARTQRRTMRRLRRERGANWIKAPARVLTVAELKRRVGKGGAK